MVTHAQPAEQLSGFARALAEVEQRGLRRPDEANRLEFMLLQHEVEEFLHYEADLLDSWRYEEWLELLTEDARYWMPLASNYKFGEQGREYTKELSELAWFDEGKTTLTLRVQQLMTGIHWAEEPLSRISHAVTNIRILQVEPSVDAPHELTISARFLVYRNRLRDETDLLVGKRVDRLRKLDGAWKLARREIYLDQNVLLCKNLTFLF